MKDYVECLLTDAAVNKDKEPKKTCKFQPRAKLDTSNPNDQWLYGDLAGQTAEDGFEEHVRGLSGDFGGPTN